MENDCLKASIAVPFRARNKKMQFGFSQNNYLKPTSLEKDCFKESVVVPFRARNKKKCNLALAKIDTAIGFNCPRLVSSPIEYGAVRTPNLDKILTKRHQQWQGNTLTLAGYDINMAG